MSKDNSSHRFMAKVPNTDEGWSKIEALKGIINKDSNPNGSSNNIAGILNESKNILGMMPHPERLIDPLLSGEDGSIIFQSLLKLKCKLFQK